MQNKSEQRAALPAQDARALQAMLANALSDADRSFDQTMSVLRARRALLRQSVQSGLTEATLSAQAAAELLSMAARRDVQAISCAALEDAVCRFGPLRGAFCVLALGKLGGREMTLGSDLDLMFVFEADLDDRDAFRRLPREVVRGLSAWTVDGGLHDVDMRLRPYGEKGPLAVQFSALHRYYTEEAWAFELQAMTRADAIAGDAEFGAEVRHELTTALRAGARRLDIGSDVAAMRARLERQKPAEGVWDVKMAPGGLIDIEFIVQAAQLELLRAGAPWRWPNTGDAIAGLGAIGALSDSEVEALHSAWALYSELGQVRAAFNLSCKDFDGARERELASALRICAADSHEALRKRLLAAQSDVRRVFKARLPDCARTASAA